VECFTSSLKKCGFLVYSRRIIHSSCTLSNFTAQAPIFENDLDITDDINDDEILDGLEEAQYTEWILVLCRKK
jgi:hypothetical protein